jgi:hypothetical protein
MRPPSSTQTKIMTIGVDVEENFLSARAMEYMRRILMSKEIEACPLSDSDLEDLCCEQLQGSTGSNYCFKVYDRTNQKKAVFVKHHVEVVTTAVENLGMKIFSKYTPNMAPAVFRFDAETRYLVTEVYVNCDSH